ncbi:O-antigen translocase [Rheinheimera sp. NSM]|uniref:O-antigen translocase n=1 Tax=Rheinheimera sp. NSM TaxID=3457884 RepID=UPI004035417E
MNLIKTSALSFMATIIKILSGIIINKAVAVFIGPAGLAVIGQFQNISQIAMTLARGGINNGVTKYIAEYGSNNSKTVSHISTAAAMTTACSIFVGVICIYSSSYIAENWLHEVALSYVVVVLGVTLIFFSLNQLLLSILNGLREIKKFILINIIQSLFSLVFTSLLIFFWRLDGALIALVTNQSIIFFIIIWLLRKHEVIKLKNFLNKFNTVEAKKLLTYSSMALTTAATVPVSQMIVRNYIVDNVGLEGAGYWQAVLFISTTYLMVVTTALTVYYLPRLSEINNKSELRQEILSGFKIIVPVVIIMSLSVFILRDFIVWVLFSGEFSAMRNLFKWQLLGDTIRISALLFAYIMHAKAMRDLYIITEIVFSFLFVFFSFFFISIYGLEGAVMAYAANYTLYFIVISYKTREKWL